MGILTKTQISILANNSDVVDLFTELDISFNRIEGQTSEQLKELVEDKYQRKRNSLSDKWEDLKSKGDNQGADLIGNDGIALQKRVVKILNTIENIGYTPLIIDSGQKVNLKSYKRLITGITFSLLALGLISFFAILYFKTKEKLDNLLIASLEKGKLEGKEEGKEEATSLFKTREESLMKEKKREQESLESKFKNDTAGLLNGYRKLLDKRDKDHAKTRKELDEANIKINTQIVEISGKSSEINNLNRKLSEESKKQKIIHDTIWQSSPQINKEIKNNNNEQNYFEELIQMKNSGEIISFEIDIKLKKNNKDKAIESKVNSIKESINTKGKKE